MIQELPLNAFRNVTLIHIKARSNGLFCNVSGKKTESAMSAMTPRVPPKCAHCETIQTIPEWSENAGDERVFFWHCMTCGHEFETRDRAADGQMSEGELAEEFLPNLVVE